jgi:hypothetical protein
MRPVSGTKEEPLTEVGTRSDLRTLRRNPKIEEAPLEKELMLFDPESSRFYVLNPTMAYIWKSWDEGATPEGIVQRLSREFEGVDTEAAGADVLRAVEDMVAKGLLLDAREKSH